MKQDTRGILCSLTAGVCWGLSGTVGQFLFSEKNVESDWLSVIRMLGAGLLLFLCCLAREKREVFRVWGNRRDAVRLLLFGILGLMTVQYSYMQAIYYSNSGTATAIQYTGEVLILMYSCVSLRRRPYLYETVGLLLALAGIFCLTTNGNPGALAISREGLIWGLISAVSLMLYTVLPSPLIRKYGSMPIVSYGMLIGGVLLALLSRKSLNTDCLGDPVVVIGVAVVVVVGTLCGFSLYLKSTVLIGGLKAGLFASVETIAAPFFSSVWLKTDFTVYDDIGFVCILLMAILMSVRGSKTEEG